MSDINIASILADYFRNEDVACPEIEVLILDDKHAEIVDAVMKAHWKSIAPVKLTDEELAQIWGRVEKQTRRGKPAATSLKLRIKRFSYSAAAVLVLVAGIYIALHLSHPPGEMPLVSKVALRSEAPASPVTQVRTPMDSLVVIPKTSAALPKYVPIVERQESLEQEITVAAETPDTVQEQRVEYTTAQGETIEVLLADESLVRVYDQTRLSFPKEFGDSVREVSLSGRAYFQVTHRAASTFRVSTSDVLVEVLGTEFDARTYDAENESVIRVEKGCVRVSIPDNTRFVLTANQLLIYNKTTKTVSILKETVHDKSKRKKRN